MNATCTSLRGGMSVGVSVHPHPRTASSMPCRVESAALRLFCAWIEPRCEAGLGSHWSASSCLSSLSLLRVPTRLCIRTGRSYTSTPSLNRLGADATCVGVTHQFAAAVWPFEISLVSGGLCVFGPKQHASCVSISVRTSNQSRIPAEFKHITRRRKRN